MNENKLTITSALPYIHGVPHLGNIVGSLLPADIFHRYQDLRGNDNIFVCGSDVHGTPLELEALEQDMPVEELKQQNHEKVKTVLNDFDMDFSIYSNTHSEYNEKQTHEMFVELYSNGYIKEETQTLPYSDEDGRFLPDRYIEGECPECGGLARGDQCDECGTLLEPEELIEPYSTISGSTDIEFRETKHLFLDLPKFKDELLEWLENADSTPIPDNKVEEVKNSIEDTEARCITRDINWGFDIPVEKVNERIDEEGLEVEKLDAEVYSEKVLYVWFDAPIGYIGFTRELFEDSDEWKDYWMNDNSDVYYSIGKDNTIFHTVIWPSMLLGASTEDEEYNLPHYEFIQQFLLAEDTKFSKSRGKGLSTEDALDMYPADYWRFYLAKNLPQQHDSTFSWDDFEKEINNVLNDTVGNFVNRTLSLAEQWFDNEVPIADLRPEDREVEDEALNIVDDYIEAFENHDLRTGVEKATEMARIGDQYLSEEEPWNNEDRREETIHVSLHLIRAIGVMLYPYTPEASQKISEMLNTDIHTEEGADELVEPLLGNLESGHELGDKEILFEKIDVEEDRPEIQDKNEEEEGLNDMKGLVSFEEFQDMDIRVGKVLKVEDHPNADKLYKVQLDVGDKELQTCAGLVNHYSKEELEGRQVIVLSNLEPTELRGEKSECMMLAAEDEEGNVELLGLKKRMKNGSEVR